ncbi:PAS domain S-box protein [Bremerella cremea]|uniref:histidine kinase n=1 Tax=Bremerella cremea TaxID=1031537 RepID=A0A368KJ29_9BACT|nr:PAS domain S-box protein [Bremerella cremea]RCS40509.1 PAS domain S-box protein [Bremerella cremea]
MAKKLRLLIVEDDPAHARLIMRGFRSEMEEFELTTSFSLKNAREAIEAELPDLVIVDLSLPDGVGAELIESHLPVQRYPVMIITSQGDEQTAVEMLKRGAIDYVVKSDGGFEDLPRLARRSIREWRLQCEKVEAEEALRNSEQRYRAIIDHSPMSIVVACQERIVLANGMALTCLGANSTTQIVGRSIHDFAIPNEETLAKHTGEVVGVRSPAMMNEYVLRRVNGSLLDVELMTTPVDYYGQDATQYVFQDITLRKEAETEMRIRDRAIASASDGIFIVQLANEKIYVVDCNQAFLEIVGCARDTVRQAGLNVIRCDTRNEGRLHLIVSAILARQPVRDTLRIQTDDETFRWVEISISPVQVSDSQSAHVVGVVHDITEKVNAEEEIRKRNAELAHFLRLTAMGELVAGLAHEVNQPLYAISNYAGTCENLLKNRDNLDLPSVSQCVSRIGQQARRAAEIIRRLRNYVSRTAPKVEAVPLADLFSDSIALLGPLLEEQAVEVEIRRTDSLPEVFVDKIQIEQVLTNLISNATDAIDDSNSERVIEVETQVVEAKGDPLVQVSVRDYGVGLPPDFDVFEAFQSTKETGMGMGLSISRTIIESHGGRIWVEAAPSRGTIFFFTLPTTIQQVTGHADESDRLCH